MLMDLDFNKSAVVARSTSQISTRLGEEIVVLSVETGRYFQMDGVAARVWDLIESPRPFEDLCSLLEEEYSVGLDRCVVEVRGFVESLVKVGLAQLGKIDV